MRQTIVGGYYNTLSIGTEYNSLFGGDNWFATEVNQEQIVSTAGTLKNLYVELNDSPGAGKSYTFTVRQNGADPASGLVVAIADTATSGSDTSNTISVSAGDRICLKCSGSNSPTARYARWSVDFEGSTANESLILGRGDIVSKVDTEYNQVAASCITYESRWSTTENDHRQVCPTAGVIKNLYVNLTADPGTDPDAFRFTLRKGGVSTALTCTITANNTTGNDTANEVSVSAGDVLTFMCEPLNTPSSTTSRARWGMTFVATTNGESIILGGTHDDLPTAATEYNYLGPGDNWNATEAECYQLSGACTLKNLYVLLSGAPSSGDKYTFTVRQNGASPGSGLVVEIADTATTGNDTTNTISVSASDELDLMVEPYSNPDAQDAYWGLVCYVAAAASTRGWAQK